MDTKQYKVTCNNCTSSRLIKVTKSNLRAEIDWLEQEHGIDHDIVSARPRLDGEIGWQCMCGNNDLLTTQEKRTFSNPVSPSPQELNEIIKNLVPDKPKFELQEA